MPPGGLISPVVSTVVPVATLVSLMSAHDISVAWPAAEDFLGDLVEGPAYPLDAVMECLADEVFTLRTLDTERAVPHAHVTHL